jgi:hypothetical protein
VLSDVTPPYPPANDALPDEADANSLRSQVLDRLQDAIDEVTSVAELHRIATAALVLRHGGGVAA